MKQPTKVFIPASSNSVYTYPLSHKQSLSTYKIDILYRYINEKERYGGRTIRHPFGYNSVWMTYKGGGLLRKVTGMIYKKYKQNYVVGLEPLGRREYYTEPRETSNSNYIKYNFEDIETCD
jgi:hypothetical protein